MFCSWIRFGCVSLLASFFSRSTCSRTPRFVLNDWVVLTAVTLFDAFFALSRPVSAIFTVCIAYGIRNEDTMTGKLCRWRSAASTQYLFWYLSTLCLRPCENWDANAAHLHSLQMKFQTEFSNKNVTFLLFPDNILFRPGDPYFWYVYTLYKLVEINR